MQRITHSLSCLVVAIALILVGPGVSGPTKGDMLIEICSDDATRMVWIDAEGNPVSSDGNHAKCLECLLFSAPPPGISDGLLARRPRLLAAGHSRLAPRPVLPIAYLRPVPRGPPAAQDSVMRVGAPYPDAQTDHSSGQRLLDHQQVAPGFELNGRRAIT